MSCVLCTCKDLIRYDDIFDIEWQTGVHIINDNSIKKRCTHKQTRPNRSTRLTYGYGNGDGDGNDNGNANMCQFPVKISQNSYQSPRESDRGRRNNNKKLHSTSMSCSIETKAARVRVHDENANVKLIGEHQESVPILVNESN